MRLPTLAVRAASSIESALGAADGHVIYKEAAKEIEAFPRKAGKRRAHGPIFAHRTAGP